MTERIFIEIAICVCFYFIGAYATTDILRLLKGNEQNVNKGGCMCPNCGYKIRLWDQIPIFSYLVHHGKCKNCKSPIPPANFYLEVAMFGYMTFISFFNDFGFWAYISCIIFYEGVKFCMILYKGKKEKDFEKNLISSIGMNVLIFALLGFLFLVGSMV